jgi:hypothetical protein
VLLRSLHEFSYERDYEERRSGILCLKKDRGVRRLLLSGGLSACLNNCRKRRLQIKLIEYLLIIKKRIRSYSLNSKLLIYIDPNLFDF